MPTVSQSYGEEHHKQAFEIYYRTRNHKFIQRDLKIQYLTVFEWKSKEFRCRAGCQWHGWDEIIEEMAKANEARFALVKEGIVDPILHEHAIRNAIATSNEKPKRLNNILELVRTDEERIQHWEVIYGKAFFTATGIATDYDSARSMSPDSDSMKMLYSRGLNSTSLRDAVAIMAEAQAQVEKIKGRFMLVSPLTVNGVVAEPEKKLTLEQLRDYKKLAENTDPKELEKIRIESSGVKA